MDPRNKYRLLPGGVATIELTHGKVALVDTFYLERLLQHRWRAHFNGRRWYAITDIKHRSMLMHRLILGAGGCVDHRNHDTLDNRAQNLREASASQNAANRKEPARGVWLHRPSGKWQAYIKWHGRRYTKLFGSEQEALAWRVEMEQKLFGEFAPRRLQ